MSDSLRPHESQHARPPCPSPTPGLHSDSRPSSRWCHPAISSSVVPFSSCPQSLPASESFPMSQLFAWGGQQLWLICVVVQQKPTLNCKAIFYQLKNRIKKKKLLPRKQGIDFKLFSQSLSYNVYLPEEKTIKLKKVITRFLSFTRDVFFPYLGSVQIGGLDRMISLFTSSFSKSPPAKHQR